MSGDLLGINSGTVSTTEASVPLIQLTNTSLDNTIGSGGTDLLYIGGSAALTMAGPFLSASGGAITTLGSLLHLDGSATLTATTSQPLFQFTNVTFDSTTNGSYSPAIFAISQGASLTLTGPLMSMSGGTADANGPILRLDNALLNAANATIFQIAGGGGVTTNKIDSSGGIYLYNSQITAQQVVSLTNSQIQITNGPLLNVTGGSQMTITGDLATLTNGARITVSNGPLIAVDGATSKLTVNGALANFVGTGQPGHHHQLAHTRQHVCDDPSADRGRRNGHLWSRQHFHQRGWRHHDRERDDGGRERAVQRKRDQVNERRHRRHQGRASDVIAKSFRQRTGPAESLPGRCVLG